MWQSQTLAEQKRLASEGDLAAEPGSMIDPTADRFKTSASDAAWLAHVNRWRTEARVAPIGENSWLSLGSTQHAQYLGEFLKRVSQAQAIKILNIRLIY
ncbi:MAG: hypothetical protein FJ147_17865 [Deltaproteobacteria bacterium]|nr:hypothetical protein [Deltaproteobacteria bacterium]